MQTIEILPGSTAKPFDEGYLHEIEDELDVSFPDSYVTFMKVSNGGEPIQKFFRMDNNEKVVERFLSFVESYKTEQLGIYDVEVVWSQIEDRLEEGVWPFAVVFAGDFLCFDSRQTVVPRVVLWNHERSQPGKPELMYVAENFEEFVNMLHK